MALTLTPLKPIEDEQARLQLSPLQMGRAPQVQNVGQNLLQQIAQMRDVTQRQIPAGSERVLRDVLGGLATGLGGRDVGARIAPKGANLLDQLIQGAAGYAPYAATAEVSAPASVAERLGAQGLAGGAYSGVTEKTPEAMILGALGGLAGEGLGAGVSALSPTRIARQLGEQAVPGVSGLRTPGEVAEISERVGDVPVNVFEAMGYQPGARATIGTGAVIPFSGMGKDARAVQHAINSKTDDISQVLLGGSTPQTLMHDLQGDVKNTYESLNNDMGNKFKQIADLADEAGVKIKGKNVKQAAENILATEKKKLISDLDPSVKTQLKEITEKDPTETNYNDAHFAHSHLTQLERNLAQKQDFGSARSIAPLKEAIRKDMSDGLKDAGLDYLQGDWNRARQEFAQKVAPFRDKSIYKKMYGTVTPKNLHTQLTDGSESSDAVMDLLPQETKNKIAYQYVQSAQKGDELTPTAFTRAYEKQIPKHAREDLLTPGMHEDFNTLDALLKSSPETRTYLAQPFTGGRTMATLKGIGALGAGLGLAHAGLSPTDVGLLLGGISGAGRAAQKGVTSPAAREFYETAPQRTGLLEQLGAGVRRAAPAALVPTLTSQLGASQ